MNEKLNDTRRDFLKVAVAFPAATAAAVAAPWAMAQEPAATVAPTAGPDIAPVDRVFITNEDSNTISVINPMGNTVDTTINLTSFDEDARPPFRFVTGGVMPTHAAMIHKPLYHGCVDAHGAVPNPDGTLLATSGRGSSNIYLIDAVNRRVLGNAVNPQAGPTTSPERLSSGILLGREPHEPTFTRNGKELWVTLRGEDRIAILDVAQATRQAGGEPAGAVRGYLPTLNGPAQVWFSKDGLLAFVISQKVAQLEIFQVNPDAKGHSRPKRLRLVDLGMQDKPAFTPFQKLSPDGSQMWLSHKLADAVSIVSVKDPGTVLATLALGEMARPNHLEFVDNAGGQVTYMSLARVDDGGPNGAASSRLAIIDRSVPLAQQKVVGMVFTGGREAHGLWTNPANNLLYVAHEQDELPGTAHAGQVVCSAFDVSAPLQPRLITQIPLGSLKLPSGELRNKKSINLVYVRPGAKGQTA
ncbi:YncE family protein [Polaromonas glacialis]|uniref:YncE family protein n=1 Tax=Polaromonas glacialis TaxID=866564 RepID=UPI00049789C3|nr:YncE family protein [Polaromonas glacialis]